MDSLDDIKRDVRTALPTEAQRVEMDGRLDLAADDAAFVGALLRMAWQAKGAPVLAQRVLDWSNR